MNRVRVASVEGTEVCVGTMFKYIADGALHALPGVTCQHCERSDRPVYPYRGKIIDPARAADPDLARKEPDIEELCVDCILGGNVRRSDVEMSEIGPTIESFAADKAKAVEEYQRMPRVTFLQHEAWPMCCGDFAEYIGKHPAPGTTFDDYECWKPQDAKVSQFKLAEFYPLEKLQAIYTMALFRCMHCVRKYWVFQYSGMFWRGPLEAKGT